MYLFEEFWRSVPKEPHERLDGGKASITRAGAIASLSLEVTEKVKNQGRVELLDRQ